MCCVENMEMGGLYLNEILVHLMFRVALIKNTILKSCFNTSNLINDWITQHFDQ